MDKPITSFSPSCTTSFTSCQSQSACSSTCSEASTWVGSPLLHTRRGCAENPHDVPHRADGAQAVFQRRRVIGKAAQSVSRRRNICERLRREDPPRLGLAGPNEHRANVAVLGIHRASETSRRLVDSDQPAVRNPVLLTVTHVYPLLSVRSGAASPRNRSSSRLAPSESSQPRSTAVPKAVVNVAAARPSSTLRSVSLSSSNSTRKA